MIRAVVLVLLGVFLSSQGKTQTNFAFANVLSFLLSRATASLLGLAVPIESSYP